MTDRESHAKTSIQSIDRYKIGRPPGVHSSCYKKIKAPKTARKFYEEEEDGIGGHTLVEALHGVAKTREKRRRRKKGVVRVTITRIRRVRIKVMMIIIEIVIILVIIEATERWQQQSFPWRKHRCRWDIGIKRKGCISTPPKMCTKAVRTSFRS